MTTIDIARNALKGVSKGTPVKDAAEIVRRAIEAKSANRYVLQRDVTSSHERWRIVAKNGGDVPDFIVSESNYDRNGLMVSLYQMR